MAKNALVLEGGGMRCIFTAGVLESFLEREISFDTIYAISAGATAATSFLSGQKGRNKRVFADYVNDPEYMGLKYYFKHKSYFNIDYIFREIPDVIDPFDYDAFLKNPTNFKVVLTNCETGLAEYFDIAGTKKHITDILIAATSLPLMAPPVLIDGQHYLDGGAALPILCDEVLEKDYDHITFVLTQKLGYKKVPEKFLPFIRVLLRRYPKIAELIKVRHTVYNERIAKIHSLANDPRITVVYPSDDFAVKRVDDDRQNILNGYQDGYQQGLKLEY